MVHSLATASGEGAQVEQQRVEKAIRSCQIKSSNEEETNEEALSFQIAACRALCMFMFVTRLR